MIRLDPIVLSFRGYNETIEDTKFLSEETAPYNLVGTVTISDDEAYISATLGKLTKATLTELNRHLYKYGVTHMKWKHKGKIQYMELRGVL